MLEPSNNDELPAIPGKRYFTIGEVSELCGVKPHVLRYWEQEFPQLKPVKRRGNRRYYQRQDVLVIRQIRALLYDQGFTIGGARNRLEGEEAREDVTQAHQLARQLRAELEELIKILRRYGTHGRFCGHFRYTSSPVGAWRSLVAHLHGVQGVPSSNLGAPTSFETPSPRQCCGSIVSRARTSSSSDHANGLSTRTPVGA
jgi:DNA-binding transcriptional MerR regulator